MKSIALILLGTILSFNLLAQAPPEAFNYSGAARDAAGNPISEKTIGVELSILKGSPSGAVQYRERHFVNTDKFGVFNCNVGQGGVQQGAFSSIEWFNDSYYLRVGFDANGGANFVVLGTTQLLSVPYALYAKTAGSITTMSGELKPVVELTDLFSFIKVDNDYRFTASAVVYSEGSSPVSEKGFVWSNTSNPTTNNNKTVVGSGAGSYNATVSGITGPDAYVRAFASNAAGTKYSDRQFQLRSLLPEVTTNSVNLISSFPVQAQSNLTVVNAGGAELRRVGVCWSKDRDLLVSGNGSCANSSQVQEGTTTVSLNNLQSQSTYYVRGFAENEFGITYGNELILNTAAFIPGEVNGTYVGKHIVSDPFLLNVFTTIDSSFVNFFPDTIVISNAQQNGLVDLTSKYLGNKTIQCNILNATGGNVVQKNLGTVEIFSELILNNCIIKSSSSVRFSNNTTFSARWNLSGTIDLGGTPLNLPNISTTGDFIKQ